MAKTTPTNTTTTSQSPPKEKKATKQPKEKAAKEPKEKAVKEPKEKAVKEPKEKAVKEPKEKAVKEPKEKDDEIASDEDCGDEDVLTMLMAKSAQCRASISKANAALAACKLEHKSLEKAWAKQLKFAIKAANKKKAKASSRKPSGFVKPARISPELAAFLGKPVGHEMSRTETTKEINAYVLANNLRDPKNGRVILADDKLLKLLNITDKVHLTYFNLQTYMKVHFKKADETVQVGSEPITA
jgi:chromatin remodeling complex protein RSC6